MNPRGRRMVTVARSATSVEERGTNPPESRTAYEAAREATDPSTKNYAGGGATDRAGSPSCEGNAVVSGEAHAGRIAEVDRIGTRVEVVSRVKISATPVS